MTGLLSSRFALQASPSPRLWLAALLIVPLLTLAQGTRTTDSEVSHTRQQSLENSSPAQDWGLTSAEWARYQRLMEGPLGVYSANLDPLTALGIEARTETELRRYAELQVLAEARRVEKLLVYQRAYDAAWQRLFPGLQPVMSPAAITTTPITNSPQRLAVFVRDDCPPCEKRVQQLQDGGTGFDLYMVGSGQDDSQLRQWATQAGVDPNKVRSGAITLNHDGGRWQSLDLAGDLPAVIQKVNSQWQRQ